MTGVFIADERTVFRFVNTQNMHGVIGVRGTVLIRDFMGAFWAPVFRQLAATFDTLHVHSASSIGVQCPHQPHTWNAGAAFTPP